MAEILRNLIQYMGLSDDIPDSSSIFKQLNVEMIYGLPTAKPDIEQIVKVISELKIKNTHVIKTPVGVSLEGQQLTGWKMVVEGCILQKIQFVADEPEQSVHGAHAEIPFSTFIVLPEDFTLNTPVFVHGYIEDIFVQMTDKRNIFNNITILLTADFC